MTKNKEDTTLMRHAKRELRLAKLLGDDPSIDTYIGRQVLGLLHVHTQARNSESSAMEVLRVYTLLVQQEPLSPLENPMTTGEYRDVSEYSDDPAGTKLQATRDTALFSDDSGHTWWHLTKYQTKTQRFFRELARFLTPILPSALRHFLWIRTRGIAFN